MRDFCASNAGVALKASRGFIQGFDGKFARLKRRAYKGPYS